MDRSRRIDITLLSEDLKDLINASSKIFPLLDASDLPTTYDKDYYRVTGGKWRNHVYAWVVETGRYELIGADDREVDWLEIFNKPTTFMPSAHNHDTAYAPISHEHSEKDIIDIDKYTKLETDTKIQEAVASKVGKEEGKSLTSNDFTSALKQKLESLSDTAGVDYSMMDSRLTNHSEDTVLHVDEAEKALIASVSSKASKVYVDTELSKKADGTTLSGHTSNAAVHVTQIQKDGWSAKTKIVVSKIEPSVDAGDMWYKEV